MNNMILNNCYNKAIMVAVLAGGLVAFILIYGFMKVAWR